jgi:hypothetical protein
MKVISKWKFRRVNSNFFIRANKIFFWMDDSSQTVESTSLNFRVRVEFESLAKCDSSRLESEFWLGLAHPWFNNRNLKREKWYNNTNYENLTGTEIKKSYFRRIFLTDSNEACLKIVDWMIKQLYWLWKIDFWSMKTRT